MSSSCTGYCVFVGGAMMFSMAPEAAVLFHSDVHDGEIFDRHARTMMASLPLDDFPE